MADLAPTTSNRPAELGGKSLLSDFAALQEARQTAMAVTSVLRLPFRNRVWKGAAGEFRGSGVGSSIDFQDHRSYLPGDDPRHINWQAFARTGNYTMKLFREEVRPQVDIVFDVSRSMFVDDTKAARSLELFFFSSNSAQQTGASVKVWLVCGKRHAFVPDIAIDTQEWAVTAANQQQECTTNSDCDAPALHEIPLRANAMRVLISDLLFPESPDRLVAALAARNGRGVILAPFCSKEADPQWRGNYEFIEAEDRSRHLRRIEPLLLERYRAAYSNHFGLWKSVGNKYDVAFARVAAEPALESALQTEGIAQRAVETQV